MCTGTQARAEVRFLFSPHSQTRENGYLMPQERIKHWVRTRGVSPGTAWITGINLSRAFGIPKICEVAMPVRKPHQGKPGRLSAWQNGEVAKLVDAACLCRK